MDSLVIPAATKPKQKQNINREEFELFLIYEGRLLDDREFEKWMDLYTDDGVYWVPSTDGQPDPYNDASLFFDVKQLL